MQQQQQATNGYKQGVGMEAPASATLKVEYRGYEILFTLRDYSGYTLIEKVEKAIDMLEGIGAQPAPQRGRGGSKSTKPKVEAPTDGSAPVCPKHNRPMRSGKWGWYCSARDDSTDNGYCDYRAKT